MYSYDLARKRIKRNIKIISNVKYEIFKIIGIKINSNYDLLINEINKIFEDLNIVKKIYLGSKMYLILKSEPLDIFFRLIDLNTIVKMINNNYNEEINIKIGLAINNDFLINQVSDKSINELEDMLRLDINGIILNKYAYRKIIKEPKNSRLWFNKIDEYYNCDIVFSEMC